MTKSKTKYYVVWKGRKPGIYESWRECEEQIKGFEGASFKGFESMPEAEAAIKEGRKFTTVKKTIDSPGTSSGIITPSLSVDAACSGNPGAMEYRGVDTANGKEIFHFGPYPMGTNNIGEFLALVHALALFHKKGLDLPIYTDSLTARKWVKDKAVKTKLPVTPETRALHELIVRAITWLNTHTYKNPILTWDTKAWGQIPADFGRK